MRNYSYGIMLFIILMGVLTVTGCAGSAAYWQSIPESRDYRPPPVETDIQQLYAEFVENENKALEKYEGTRLYFSQIEVESVAGNSFFISQYRGAGDLDYLKLYFTSGQAMFKLRNEYFDTMQFIEEGFVLNIEGTPKGLQNGSLVIEECWVESLIGDLGQGQEIERY